jgi:hypothetical protein
VSATGYGWDRPRQASSCLAPHGGPPGVIDWTPDGDRAD